MAVRRLVVLQQIPRTHVPGLWKQAVFRPVPGPSAHSLEGKSSYLECMSKVVERGKVLAGRPTAPDTSKLQQRPHIAKGLHQAYAMDLLRLARTLCSGCSS